VGRKGCRKRSPLGTLRETIYGISSRWGKKSGGRGATGPKHSAGIRDWNKETIKAAVFRSVGIRKKTREGRTGLVGQTEKTIKEVGKKFPVRRELLYREGWKMVPPEAC